jgi:hypothetical protein
VVLLLLVWGGYHLLSTGSDTSQPVPPAPVLTAPKPVAKPAPQPVVAPPQTAVPSPAADASPPPAAATADQQASALPPPAAGAKSPATRATQMSSGSPTAVAAPDPSAAVAVPGAGQIYGAQNRNARVVLRARADTTLTVKNPAGQIMLNRVLKAGDIYQVPDMPGLSMAASDASAVEVDLDGVSLGRAGKTQIPVGKVSLDAQSLADRFNNH